MTIFFHLPSHWQKCKDELLNFHKCDVYENMPLSEEDKETLEKVIHHLTFLADGRILMGTEHSKYVRIFGSESTLYHLIQDYFGDNAGVQYSSFAFQSDKDFDDKFCDALEKLNKNKNKKNYI